MPRPNVIFVFGDQWRAQATGYADDPNVRTPNLDRLAAQSVNFTNAVSGCPICTPYRASLITGQYPLTHGLFVNDVCLSDRATSIAQAFTQGGYNTAYIGKWHLDGHGRTAFIPRERRQGFDFWRVLECTHSYNNSMYYGDDPTPLKWEGYDAIAQTRCATEYIRQYDSDKPFLMMLSWGPPHNDYATAPAEYRRMYDPACLTLRPNVFEAAWHPKNYGDMARIRADLAGYYSHCSALDDCMGAIVQSIRDKHIEGDTILVFTSDHGDMLGSQGCWRKQVPYEESICVPFLLRWPAGLGLHGTQTPLIIDAPDIMPSLLGLCRLAIPQTVEGRNYAEGVTSGQTDGLDDTAVLTEVHPFTEWLRENGGREYRGLRTRRHTYVRDLNGPWLLFDNQADPYQMTNLVGSAEHEALKDQLDALLTGKLAQRGDEFKPSEYYLRKWGYTRFLPKQP